MGESYKQIIWSISERAPSAEFMLRIAAYFNLLVEDVFKLEEHSPKLDSSSLGMFCMWFIKKIGYCLIAH